jgi:hypothetical protein
MVRADDLAPGCPRAADCREMIGRLHLEPRAAPFRVPRARRIFDDVRGADEQAAAFIGKLFDCVRDYLIQDLLPYLHATSITMAVPMPPPICPLSIVDCRLSIDGLAIDGLAIGR